MDRLASRSAWALVLACLATATAGAQIVINEIHYAPAERTSLEEFVELHNAGGGTVDLSGWYFSDGIDFTFAPGTTLGAGDYLVVAQDPGVLTAKYGAVPVVGPYIGGLDSDGESVVLRGADGFVEDEVDYRRGFPWPVVGPPEGLSIELVHPALDNDLGGSWRPSDSDPVEPGGELIAAGSEWRYRKGSSEPPPDWREPGFADGSWSEGQASIGYGEAFIRTELDDMRDGYSSVSLRRTFTVDDPGQIGGLALEVQFDDGFNAWINGVHVAGSNVPGQDLPFDETANSALEEHDFVAFSLPPVGGFLAAGENVIAVQLLNASLGGSSDAFFDARLVPSRGGGAGPSPGGRNRVWSTSLAPHVRQVNHRPKSPTSADDVVVSIKVTDPDGVAAVLLEYQVVDPGSYFSEEDPEFLEGWTPVPMSDDGLGGDEAPGDDFWSVTLPAELQVHRRLVRYRITAEDGAGNARRAPFGDDPQPNFAYFVYDALPAWVGSARPGVLPEINYHPNLLGSIPVYHFITDRQDRLNAIHVPYRWGQGDQQNPTTGEYRGSEYPWQGTLVYDGEVYDHVQYRARGGVWRYSMGKNMWKFDFRRGHYFQARDPYGKKYRATWDKLNFSAIIQQGNFRQRGEQGLFEAVGFDLHNLVGNDAPLTHFVHFRLIEAEDELGPDQFSGDFQGLYLVLEQMDGRFLDQHRLPDGNLYKMEGGTGELNNQGPTQPSNKADLNAFKGTYESGGTSESWWRDNLELEDYYGFRAISLAIHDYDMHAGKNYFYFHDPDTDRWRVFNWDLDLTWTTTYNGGGGRGPLNQYVLDPFPQFQIEYRNRVREIRDLLFNAEQVGMMLDEAAGPVYTPSLPSLVDVDRAMWDRNPILVSGYINSSKAGHGRFYEDAPGRTFAGMLQKQKDYVESRGRWLDQNEAADSRIPRRPTITSVGEPGFPIDALRFRSSDFDDPQGDDTFGAMAWRVAEITPPGAPAFDPDAPKLHEIDAVWESGELTSFTREIDIPASALTVGHLYRARVRLMDETGRWSRWSDPVEFVAGEPTTPFPQQGDLRVTELMYHPVEGSDFEFVELQNIGVDVLDLRAVAFTDGIEFGFGEGDVLDLGPGEFVLVVKNRRVFETVYDTQDMLIAGEYSGRLDNGGEGIAIAFGGNNVIQEFVYDDAWYPETDGGGASLVYIDPADPPEAWGDPSSWKPSEEVGGSPGAGDGSGPVGGRQLPADANQDGRLDIADGVALLRALFGGGVELPCDGADISAAGNLAVYDVDGGGSVNVTDVVHLLTYLFRQGPPPALGERCVRIEGCPSACSF